MKALVEYDESLSLRSLVGVILCYHAGKFSR
jgi:hypothetical protein